MQFSPSLGETSGNFAVLIRTPARFSNYYDRDNRIVVFDVLGIVWQQGRPVTANPDPEGFDQSQTWQAPEIHLEDGRILVLEYT